MSTSSLSERDGANEFACLQTGANHVKEQDAEKVLKTMSQVMTVITCIFAALDTTTTLPVTVSIVKSLLR